MGFVFMKTEHELPNIR